MKTGPVKSYKKVRKEDKSKKKLKTALKNVATKTALPKGQNLTDTNFKVKKIVIRDQVKPHDENEVLFHKKLNVTELTARLGHHNSTIKTEALDGLKGMINTHPVEVLGSHYVQVLEAVVKLVLDETASIRKSSCKIVDQILAVISRPKLSPVFASLNSYLLCGLTHINRGVREDSLVLMDACLKHVPDLCATYAFNLLSVCLDLISDKGVGSRTLSLNLEGSQIATKWRTRVLERIAALLHCLSKDFPKLRDTNKNVEPRNFVPGCVNYCPIYTDVLWNVATERNAEQTHQVTAVEFAEAIIPLLLAMFLEVNPAGRSDENSVSTVINDDACKLLTLIVDIIDTLWGILDSSSVNCQTLSKKFSGHLLQTLVAGRFPYSVRGKSSGRPQKQDGDSNTINLSVAHLVLIFTKHPQWDPVVPFLKNSFRLIEQFTPSDTVTFAACMTKICGATDFSEHDYFFTKVVQISYEGQSQLCPHLFKILGDVALSPQMRRLHAHPEFGKWLQSLPEKLVREKIQPYQLEVISKIAVRNFPSFSDSLDVNIELILDNIPKISVGDPSKKAAVQRQMATLLNWVSAWDEELTESLQPAIQNCYWGEQLTKYISEIISIKDDSVAHEEVPL